MNKEFTTYEEALALKELGFDEECFGYWLSNREIHIGKESSAAMFSAFGNVTFFSAPLYQQAFRWFRDKHSLYINLKTHTTPNEILGIIASIVSWKFLPIKIGSFMTYEEAELACLKELIKIAKEGS